MRCRTGGIGGGEALPIGSKDQQTAQAEQLASGADGIAEFVELSGFAKGRFLLPQSRSAQLVLAGVPFSSNSRR